MKNLPVVLFDRGISIPRAHARIHKVFYPCNRCHLAKLLGNQSVTCGKEVTRVTTNGVFAHRFIRHRGTETQSFYYFSVSPCLCVYQTTAWGCEAPASVGRRCRLHGTEVPPPWLFDEIRYQKGPTIIVPQTSSENRPYIPVYYSDQDIIYSNGARVVFNGQLWLFGILTSKLHNNWAQVVSGRLETRIQYSNTLCYNTFPFPKISAEKKAEIEAAAEDVLVTREFYPDKTLADLYDPDKMPQDLREAHEKLDDIVESCYPGYPFASDEARLECLFKLYEKMTKNK